MGSDRAIVTLVPQSTSSRGTRFEVAHTTTLLRTGVLDAQNPITVPKTKLIKKLGEFTTAQLSDVETAIRLWLGLA